MAVLDVNKHEHFAQAVAKGLSPTKAYISAGYSEHGAAAGASRLLKNVKVFARIKELQSEVSAGTITLEISSRNARVQALQNRWDKLRQVIDERAKHYADQKILNPAGPDSVIAGGETGLLVKDWKGKDADQPVYKVDTGLLAELRNHEKQAAEELGQWAEKQNPTGIALQTNITIRFVQPGEPLPEQP